MSVCGGGESTIVKIYMRVNRSEIQLYTLSVSNEDELCIENETLYLE